MIKVSIEEFFFRKFELESTKLLIEEPTFFSSALMEDYVRKLMDYKLSDYIDYLYRHPLNEDITSKDITQLSNIEDCTTNMCHMMLKYENKGFTLIEIATYLRSDTTYKDNATALMKYGENQVKTACQMGLTSFKNNLWYLSGVGYVICNFSEEIKKKFYAINLLRDPFYSKIILSLCERDTKLKDFMAILSESTQKRRTSSCIRVLSYFINQCKLEGVTLHNLLIK